MLKRYKALKPSWSSQHDLDILLKTFQVERTLNSHAYGLKIGLDFCENEKNNIHAEHEGNKTGQGDALT